VVTLGAGSQAPTDVEIALEEVVTGLSMPVYITHAGDGTGRLFIVEQPGTIRILQNGSLLETPFLDIRSQVDSEVNKGLLSVAFHPDYSANGRFFAFYIDLDGETVVSRFSVSESNANTVEPNSEVALLNVDLPPIADHVGGQLQFGPDGMLYVSIGDGQNPDDPFENGQDITTLLGAVLRIDVDGGDPYSIPPDNPFVGQVGRDEIWAYGLRNPWRFSFDRLTGRLFLGDVGQDVEEEINLIVKGGNYGWNIMEGFDCFSPPSGCDTTGLTLPITIYRHNLQTGFAVIGGYVYRGTQFKNLEGLYFFGDWYTGRLWALEEFRPETFTRIDLLDSDIWISSFGEDEAGELYVVDHSGSIYELVSLSKGESEGEAEGISEDESFEIELDGESGTESEGHESSPASIDCPIVAFTRDFRFDTSLRHLRDLRDALIKNSDVARDLVDLSYSSRARSDTQL